MSLRRRLAMPRMPAYDEARREARALLSRPIVAISMNPTRIILWERTGIWATALLERLPADAHVVQVRGVDDCRAELRRAPASVVAVELSRHNLPGVVRLTCDATCHFSLAAVVILGEPALADCKPLLAEAGALHFFRSPRELAGCRRLFGNHFNRVPSRPRQVAERIWESLPWSEASSAQKG